MVFLELRRDSRVTTGNSGCLLCWPRQVLHITHLPFHCADLLAFTLGLCRASWFPFWAQPALSKTDLNRYFYFLLFLLSINKVVLDMVYLLLFIYISSTQKSRERLMANGHVPIAQSCKCQRL